MSSSLNIQHHVDIVLRSLLFIIVEKIFSSNSWMKFKVETIVKVVSPSHSLLVSSSFAPSIFFFRFFTHFLCCALPRGTIIFLKLSLSRPFSFITFFFWSFSLSKSFFDLMLTCFIWRLLGDAKLDWQGIEDLVNTNHEIDHWTPWIRSLNTVMETNQQRSPIRPLPSKTSNSQS